MAKLYEEIIVIKVSSLIRDEDAIRVIFDTETIQTLEQVIGELTKETPSLVEITLLDTEQ